MSDSFCWMSVLRTVIECLLTSNHLIQLKFLFPSTLPENPQLTTMTYGSLFSHNAQQESLAAASAATSNPLHSEMKVDESEEGKNQNVDVNELTLINTQSLFIFES